MRRGIDDPDEYAYYLAYGPKETPVHELIRVAGRRWTIEDCFEQAKGEVGLDEYEVRKWEGWHRHTTLRASWRTLTWLWCARWRSMRRGSVKGGSPSGSLPRVDPADGAGGQREILAMARPKEEREFGLGVRCGVGLIRRWPSVLMRRSVRRSVTLSKSERSISPQPRRQR